MLVADDGSLSASYSDIKFGNDELCGLEPLPVTVDDLQQHADAVSEAAKPIRNFLHQRPKTADDSGTRRLRALSPMADNLTGCLQLVQAV